MTLNNKKSNSEYLDIESFFPSLLSNDSGLKEQMNHSKQNKKSEINGKTIKKTILIQRRSPNSDIWICNNCTWTGDKWFMENIHVDRIYVINLQK